MSYQAEGEIQIPLDEFWAFVNRYIPDHDGEVRFGVPRVYKGEQDMLISYAVSADSCPENWVNPPKAVTEWKELPEYQYPKRKGETEEKSDE